MDKLRASLSKRLVERFQTQNIRNLCNPTAGIDFSSNDYLGLANNPQLRDRVQKAFDHSPSLGSTGSRLLSGNSALAMDLEDSLARRFNSQAALLFNSGMDLNIGILSTLAQPQDTILLDQHVHASLKIGAKLSKACTFYFRHNCPDHLEKKLKISQGNIFVVVESVYSMDGDIAPLLKISDLCQKFGAYLIVDEAHAAGILGPNGCGMIAKHGLENNVLGRIITFGKAFGSHGAVFLSDSLIKKALINFCIPFIYTTALPSHTLISIKESIKYLDDHPEILRDLYNNMEIFKHLLKIDDHQTPIFPIFFSDMRQLIQAQSKIKERGFKTYPIFSPTVKKGTERLRVTLHAFNTEDEIISLGKIIKDYL